jgi:GGDEF domain-containing protein
MTESAAAQEPDLDRLLEDLVRDGWLMGMNAGLDPALTRMDPATGVFCSKHFTSLVEVAIGDSRHGCTRFGDGPATGNVAVLSVHLTEWKIGSDFLHDAARALDNVLRPDDVLGRTGEWSFSLLLRGCPKETLEAIALRCVSMLKASKIAASSCAISWQDHSAKELIAESFEGLRTYSGPV